MRVLLTGSNGLFGQHLLPLLCKDPELEIFATGLGPNRRQPGKYNYYSCDLTDQGETSSLIQKIHPDYIVHAAAKTQVDWCEENQELCWKNNVEATRNLLGTINDVNCHLQYISTDFVFDGEKGNYVETDVPNPVNYYGKSKLAAEKIVLSPSDQSSILRTVLVYGVASDLSRSNILTWIWKNLQRANQIRVVTDQLRTPTYVEDLAMGSFLAIKHTATGIFHISGEQIMTPYDMALKLAHFYKLDSRLILPADAYSFSQPGKRPANTTFTIEKAKASFGFKPRSFESCLESLKTSLTNYPG